MGEMMYQRCPVCNGTQRLDPPAVVNTGGVTYDCPCKRAKYPGWAEIGVTVGQLDRTVGENGRLKSAVDAVEAAVAEVAKSYGGDIPTLLRMAPAVAIPAAVVAQLLRAHAGAKGGGG